MDDITDRACEIDHAGDAVLEYLLLLPEQELCIMGHQKARSGVGDRRCSRVGAAASAGQRRLGAKDLPWRSLRLSIASPWRLN